MFSPAAKFAKSTVIMTGKMYVIAFVCGFGGVFRMLIHDNTNIEIPIVRGTM